MYDEIAHVGLPPRSILETPLNHRQPYFGTQPTAFGRA